ncbi:MAG: hypothetical protein GXO75_17220 [Calditrichaeota bacterium]|nr:hypothetical protein [Calditrichota bacterium]
MLIRKILYLLSSIWMCGFFAFAAAQEEDFGYENWPKNGVVRSKIELPVNSFIGYGLQLTPGFTDSSVFLNLPLSEVDIVKKGRLQMSIYRTIKDAQWALVEFLYAIQSVKKPVMKQTNNLPGDVTFLDEKDDVLSLLFTRDNVMVVLVASISTAMELAQKVDSLVLATPVWTPEDSKPVFVISDEFLKSFFVKAP